jgi:hypothetical protein
MRSLPSTDGDDGGGVNIKEILRIRYPEMRSLPSTDGDDGGGVNIQETLHSSTEPLHHLATAAGLQ